MDERRQVLCSRAVRVPDHHFVRGGERIESRLFARGDVAPADSVQNHGVVWLETGRGQLARGQLGEVIGRQLGVTGGEYRDARALIARGGESGHYRDLRASLWAARGAPTVRRILQECSRQHHDRDACDQDAQAVRLNTTPSHSPVPLLIVERNGSVPPQNTRAAFAART